MSEAVRLTIDTAETVGPRRSGVRRFWTGREILILRNAYPADGLSGCLAKLPGRSAGSIYQRANALDLKAPSEAARDMPRRRHHSSEHIDDAIRRTYQNHPESGAVKHLAQTLGKPRSWIRSRAIKLGCAVPRFNAPPWTAPEAEIVRTNAHRDPKTIQRTLKRAGFSRTETAVCVQIKRLGASTEDPDHYTASGLGKIMGVNIKTVTGWIEKGWLDAKRRGTDRTEAQGGDQWWIHRRDVRRFIVANAAAVDIRKVDKFWFIDLLAGSAAE